MNVNIILMKKLIILLLILCLFSCQYKINESLKTVQQIHENWSFSQQGKSDWKAASVPGVVHLDLLKNGLIKDPYWEDNELKQQWIEEENWVYKTQINVDQETLSNENIELIFKGLDTYGEVYLNNQKIISASNMFRTWNASVKSILKIGKNDLKVVFTSPIKYNQKQVESYAYQLPSGNEIEAITTKVAGFTRKAAYHFGWDWGPRFVTAGIYRPVELVSWNKARIANVFTTSDTININKAIMKTQLEVEVTSEGQYELFLGDYKTTYTLIPGINKVEMKFTINDPKLWWTNGIGEANLYHQKIQLFSNGTLLDSTTNTYGIRTIKLINEPDSIGTSFYFKLNGKPIFIKGANYIPQDLFLPRVKPEQYERLIKAAKEANFNMIRVWGGGIYERDLFYDLCDQNGILVWQDFMFANSLYPKEKAFKENIKAEVIENIRRLRQHPCLAIWCGNNEIDVAWKNWGWQKQFGYSSKDSTEICHNYQSIFHKLIPGLVQNHNPQTAYTPTSPLSNWGIAENFNHSSMHYWGVWHGKEPFENYEKNVGRFMVEYGFQSFPSMETLQKVISEDQLHLDALMVKHRQKSYIGNGMILKHIRQYYDEPKSFSEFVNLSQKVQAKAMKMAIESHIDQQPHCMGTLFWQFNDCWPGPSWSVMDYYGNKKLAYEVVKKEYGELTSKIEK